MGHNHVICNMSRPSYGMTPRGASIDGLDTPVRTQGYKYFRLPDDARISE